MPVSIIEETLADTTVGGAARLDEKRLESAARVDVTEHQHWLNVLRAPPPSPPPTSGNNKLHEFLKTLVITTSPSCRGTDDSDDNETAALIMLNATPFRK